jgi:hypothetical protein
MSLRAFAVLSLLAAGCSTSETSSAPQAAKPEVAGESLFDGKSLGAWKSVDFGGQGEVKVENGSIRVAEGATLSGIQWTGQATPRTDYELTLEAMKVDGTDFFCGIVFPVGKKSCSFVAGGWGGGVTGLSSVDSMNASENETATDQDYKKQKWYAIRLRVTTEKIEVWIDAKQVDNLELANRQLSVHPAVEAAEPLGLTNYQTTSLFRNIRLKKLK